MGKILIVEDNGVYQDFFYSELRDKFDLIQVYSIEEAEKEFKNNPDITAIALDACVPGNKLNTLPLLGTFRETFSGPIISITSSPYYAEDMLKSGCSDHAQKYDFPNKLIEILN